METIKSFKEIELKKEGIPYFLKELKKMFLAYLEGKISKEELSDFTVRTFVVNESVSDSIEKIDPEILELRKAMDITHPDWNKNKRINYIKKLLERVDKLIEKHS